MDSRAPNYVTAEKLLAELASLQVPEFSSAEKKALNSLYQKVSPNTQGELTPEKWQSAYDKAEPPIAISKERFALFIASVKATDNIERFFAQIMQAHKAMYPEKEQGADILMEMSVSLLKMKEIDPALFEQMKAPLEKLVDIFGSKPSISTGLRSYAATTLYGICDFFTKPAKEQRDNPLSEQEKKQDEMAECVATEIINQEKMKAELVERLEAMTDAYHRLKKNKGKHESDIQNLIQQVKDAPTYASALHQVEKTILEQQKRFEEGRAISRFSRFLKLTSLTKKVFNFEKKLGKEQTSFQFPKLVLKVVEGEYAKHPELANPALAALAEKVKTPVHQDEEAFSKKTFK